MKRLWGLVLCAALVCGICGSAMMESREDSAYKLYFLEGDLRRSAGGDIYRTEDVWLEDGTPLETAEGLMTALLQGPADESLQSPIPAGTRLLSLELQGTRAVVDLTMTYAALSGVALTLADYAVALTLTQLPEIVSVQITVRGQELAYREKQVLTARDVRLSPVGDVVSTVRATLYFPDAAATLQPEERTLELYEGDTQAGAVVRAQEAGPEGGALGAVMPEGFRVLSAWLEEDVCYVNLSAAQLEGLPRGTVLYNAIDALRRSLASLEAVAEVRFLVDGEFAETYGGTAIGRPYTG